MKKISITLSLSLMAKVMIAQNVGIGTTIMDYKLHVKDSITESSIGINATGTATKALLNLSIDNRINGNSLALIKYPPGLPGNIGGIPKSNLAVITADAGAGALLIGTIQNSNMYFISNNAERMRLLVHHRHRIGTRTLQHGQTRLRSGWRQRSPWFMFRSRFLTA